MALLELKDIGKIYVSANTVSVGIRGVNLSFDRGEFVAITGQSGSGKSTLLNVISGMDSYEEGEMFIEGKETSYYTQADWEKYREKYISFIFQEYNIIDSFTVLQNVELSLMHIENAAERREKAMELIRRVGLEAHIKHKGSHLSGGQKQRTVIARALAKDSPIILADEPTGNLDANTSKEIVELLREVSRDKLLIVVTHNFEEVCDYATREIRVFDGAVASDNSIGKAEKTEVTEPIKEINTERNLKKTTKNSFKLGTTIFTSMPKLTLFMCMLVIVASAAIMFSFASFWSEVKVLLVNDNHLFHEEPGRVVLVRRDDQAITDEELQKLVEKYGAKEYLRLDNLLDKNSHQDWREFYADYEYIRVGHEPFAVVCNHDYGQLDLGRYPENENEAVLRVPYLMRDRYGKDQIEIGNYTFNESWSYGGRYCDKYSFKIVGISYYLDSDKQGELLLTKEGYEKLSAFELVNTTLKFNFDDGERTMDGMAIGFDDSIPYGEVRYGSMSMYEEELSVNMDSKDLVLTLDYSVDLNKPDRKQLDINIDRSKIKHADNISEDRKIFMSKDTLLDAVVKTVKANYGQASLIFASNSAAAAAAKELSDNGYIAVTTKAKYLVANNFEIIEYLLMGIVYLVIWVVILMFLSFLIRICTQKAMEAFKPDIAIMRSMGIRVNEIKNAIYIRIYLCVIPAIVGIPIAANWLYSTDFGGRNLRYIDPLGYVVIYLLIIIMMNRVTKKHIKMLFSENVRKALKGEEK